MRSHVCGAGLLLLGFLSACDDVPAGNGPPPDAGRVDGAGSGAGDGAAPAPDGALAGEELAALYPGDVGIGADPSVVWAENFEEGTVAQVTARYDSVSSEGEMSLLSDIPAKSGGAASLKMVAGGSAPDTDLYKKLPDHDELYVRWYAKYQAGITWHHSGVWIGGYNPAQNWPSPMAGYRPGGDDRFSVSIEPVYSIGQASPRFDFYNYWMKMHSWMQPVTDDGTSYYGNGMVHRQDFTVDPGQWVCLEVHVKLNPAPTSGAGAVLEVWKNDVLMRRFDDAGPLGYWIRDKFCPTGSDGAECTDYPAPFDTVLDLQWRSTTALQLNAFWPQNYITSGPAGAVQYDDMVAATRRVGCLR